MPNLILIVDDEENWRETFQDVFAIMQHDAVAVENYGGVKEVFEKQKVDLVILDICLDQSPQYLEFQKVCHFLHNHHRDIPVIATTGHQVDPEFAFRLHHQGISDFVSKGSFSLPEFEALITEKLKIEPFKTYYHDRDKDKSGSEIVSDLALIRLQNQIRASFSIDEVNQICFDLGINHEDLSGDTIGVRSRELVICCKRRGLLLELIAMCQKLRSSGDWGTISPRSNNENDLTMDM